MTELSLEMRPAGLHPDPNPHTDVPGGALVEAADVVIRRSGVLQPRPGLEDQSYATAVASSRRVQALHPYDGDFVVTTKATTDKLLNKDGTAITLAAADINFADHHVHSAAMRDVLYVPSADGLMRVKGADATTATLAGLPRAKSGIGSLVEAGRNADEWFAGQSGTVAYRCILSVEASDGSIRLGPPSGRWQVKASTSATPSGDRVISLTIPVHSDWAGYELQVYRSETSATDTPSDEMALAFRHTIGAAEAAAGVVTAIDETPEDERGAALYTNATQQGAEGEHRQPPTVGTVCEYRDLLFCGRVTGRGSMALPFTLVPTNWFTNSGTGETVDVTVSSTALASETWPQSSDLYGLAITELGFDPQTADTYFSANTDVSYTTGGGWVLSANALATAATQSVELCEWMGIDGPTVSFRVYFRGSSSDADVDVANKTVYANDAGLGAILYDLDRVVSNLAYLINRTDEDMTAAHLGNGVLLLETIGVGQTISVDLPRRLAENVGFDISGETATATRASDADVKPHRLIWSALQVPEGFPPTHFVDLGSESHPITALVSTQFGVYAFKYDGIWRIDGRTPTGLSAERVASARLCAPKCAGEFNGECYAWTDQGLVRVGAGGITDNLTDAALDVWLHDIQRALPEQAGALGAFLSIDRADGVFYLGVPAAATDTEAEWVYTMDVKPAAWTRWSLAATDVATIDGRLYVAIYGAFGIEATEAMRLLRARLSTDAYPHHDDSGTATVDSVDTSASPSIVFTVSGSSYKASVGDWLVTDNSVAGVITAVDGIPGFGTVDLTVSVVANAASAGSAATATIYVGPDCIVEWTTRTGTGVPLQTKRFSTCSLSFEELDRFYEADWSFYSDHAEAAATSTWTRTPEIGRVRPEVWRGGFVPRGAAWAAHMRARVAMHNPGATWALTSLALAYQPSGLRAGRRTP